MIRLDHLVVAAASLDEGVAWVEDRLGVPPATRGRHVQMGTHNALWGLGPIYLEVIAVDPEGTRPERPRWFGFDDPQVRTALEAGPKLLTWAVAAETPDHLAELARIAPVPHDPPTDFARDDLRWKVALPSGPELPLDGAWPLMICWTEGLHPARRLPDQQLRLTALRLAGVDRGRLSPLGNFGSPVPIEFDEPEAPVVLSAQIQTPEGKASI